MELIAPLQEYGFVPFFSQQVSPEEIDQNLVGRVTEVQRSRVIVFDGVEIRAVHLPAKWQNEDSEVRPTIGDWVVIERDSPGIDRVLERKSLFKRITAGGKSDIQLIAANVDILFIVTSCNEEFKESRLERYLSLAFEAGSTPVVVLTKTDLAADAQSYFARSSAIQSGIAIELVNALDEQTFGGLNTWIEPGSTVALVGSSGVGKSTILNTLAGTSRAVTGDIREDDKKGRHTTSYRALYKLNNGGLVIDVPGMRELKVADVDAGLTAVFDDIESMAQSCQFSDCAHKTEPGCAVRDAVSNGIITERRVQNYTKLTRENNRNSASLAEKRLQGRAFAKIVKEAKHFKRNQ